MTGPTQQTVDRPTSPPSAEVICSAECIRRLERVLGLLTLANERQTHFEAHNLVERAMIDVGWVRDHLPPNGWVRRAGPET